MGYPQPKDIWLGTTDKKYMACYIWSGDMVSDNY